jgi:DNA repair exonuclease SbcCD ATPase subunit
MTKTIDYLIEDEPLANQQWVCMSFISPEGLKNCKIRGIKIRGTYATKEEADERALHLQQIDPDFHVFVGQVGKWLPQDPDPNSCGDQVYREQELQNLMKSYKQNMMKAKLMEEERKHDMKEEAIRTEALNKKEQIKQRLRNKLNKNKEVEKPPVVDKQVQDKLNKLKEAEYVAKQEQLRLEATVDKIEKGEQNIKTLDENLEKIQELYDKLLKKKQDKNKDPKVDEFQN